MEFIIDFNDKPPKRPQRKYSPESELPYDDLVINEGYLEPRTKNISWIEKRQFNLFEQKVTIPEFGIYNTSLRYVKRKYRDKLFPSLIIKRIDGECIAKNRNLNAFNWDTRLTKLKKTIKKPQQTKVGKARTLKKKSQNTEKSNVLKTERASRKRNITHLEKSHGKQLKHCSCDETGRLLVQMRYMLNYLEKRYISKFKLKQAGISEPNLDEINNELVFADEANSSNSVDNENREQLDKEATKQPVQTKDKHKERNYRSDLSFFSEDEDVELDEPNRPEPSFNNSGSKLFSATSTSIPTENNSKNHKMDAKIVQLTNFEKTAPPKVSCSRKIAENLMMAEPKADGKKKPNVSEMSCSRKFAESMMMTNPIEKQKDSEPSCSRKFAGSLMMNPIEKEKVTEPSSSRKFASSGKLEPSEPTEEPSQEVQQPIGSNIEKLKLKEENYSVYIKKPTENSEEEESEYSYESYTDNENEESEIETILIEDDNDSAEVKVIEKIKDSDIKKTNEEFKDSVQFVVSSDEEDAREMDIIYERLLKALESNPRTNSKSYTDTDSFSTRDDDDNLWCHNHTLGQKVQESNQSNSHSNSEEYDKEDEETNKEESEGNKLPTKEDNIDTITSSESNEEKTNRETQESNGNEYEVYDEDETSILNEDIINIEDRRDKRKKHIFGMEIVAIHSSSYFHLITREGNHIEANLSTTSNGTATVSTIAYNQL